MPGTETGPGNTSNLDDSKPGGGALVRKSHQGHFAKTEKVQDTFQKHRKSWPNQKDKIMSRNHTEESQLSHLSGSDI